MERYGDFIRNGFSLPRWNGNRCMTFSGEAWVRKVDSYISEIGLGSIELDICSIWPLYIYEIVGDIIKAIELMEDEDEKVIIDTLCARCNQAVRNGVAKILANYYHDADSLEKLICSEYSGNRTEKPKSMVKTDSHENAQKAEQ